jgi:hypothetical protein
MVNASLIALLSIVGDSQDEVDDDGQQQNDSQHTRAKLVVEAGLAAHTDAPGSPMVGEQGVDHGGHGHDGEEEGGDEGRTVTKVQHADGQRAEDDGEVEP